MKVFLFYTGTAHWFIFSAFLCFVINLTKWEWPLHFDGDDKEESWCERWCRNGVFLSSHTILTRLCLKAAFFEEESYHSLWTWPRVPHLIIRGDFEGNSQWMSLCILECFQVSLSPYIRCARKKCSLFAPSLIAECWTKNYLKLKMLTIIYQSQHHVV